MSNPWLRVPLSEYEQHMSSADVQQLDALSDLFAEAIRRCRPSSVAVLGIAGGNGLDHIDSSITTRVLGLDLNPRYLEAVNRRYSHLPGLDLHCVDLSDQAVEFEPVELVHAALIFEHAGTNRCLENAISLTLPSGHLSSHMPLTLLDNVVGFGGPFDFRQDAVGRGGPNERLRVSIVHFHVIGNGRFQFGDGTERTAAEPVLS
jgi:hypothetical protein